MWPAPVSKPHKLDSLFRAACAGGERFFLGQAATEAAEEMLRPTGPKIS